MLDGGPTKPNVPPEVVGIGCGERRIDKTALGRHFGLNPKRIKLAHPDVVLDRLGYPAGAPKGHPPLFGHRTPLPVLLDAAVIEQASTLRRPHLWRRR